MKKENIKIDVKKVSIESLIRKEKYIDQFKDLVLESKKIGKVSFTKIKKFFNHKHFFISIFFISITLISIARVKYCPPENNRILRRTIEFLSIMLG